MPHMLITGCSGCGKTTLARSIAEEVDALFFRREARVFKDSEMLAQYLIDCIEQGRQRNKKVVILLDEIHALKKEVQETLYFPMVEHQVDTAKGFVQLGEDFCIIGATTDKAALTKPLVSRFGSEVWDIGRYPTMLLATIVGRKFVSVGFNFDLQAAIAIGSRGLGIPRRCELMADAVIDVVRARDGDYVTEDDVLDVVEMEGLDELGLDPIQQRYIAVLQRGPCKIAVLSSRVEQPDALLKAEVEPVLIALGMLSISGGGTRMLTELGKAYGLEKRGETASEMI